MEEWLGTEASDGFTVMFPYLPGGLDDFVNLVVPELQQRGLFRRAYVDRLLANPEGELTPKRHSKLWQVALLEGWLQAQGI